VTGPHALEQAEWHRSRGLRSVPIRPSTGLQKPGWVHGPVEGQYWCRLTRGSEMSSWPTAFLPCGQRHLAWYLPPTQPGEQGRAASVRGHSGSASALDFVSPTLCAEHQDKSTFPPNSQFFLCFTLHSGCPQTIIPALRNSVTLMYKDLGGTEAGRRACKVTQSIRTSARELLPFSLECLPDPRKSS
jgi:hypothetical protein